MKIGVIGVVKDELKADFFGTAEGLRKIGYQGIEIGTKTIEDCGLSAVEFGAQMTALKMAIPTCHCTKFVYEEKGEALMEMAAAAGAESLCVSWGPTESAEQIRQDAGIYNEMATLCRKHGMAFTYHNHDHEFAFVEDSDVRFLDLLMGETDDDLVKLHLDLAWAHFGGVNPVDYTRRYAKRIHIFHMKDLKGLEPGCEKARGERSDARFTEVGEGVVPIAKVVELLPETTAQWAVVEQDRLGDLPGWESVELSFRNLSRMMR